MKYVLITFILLLLVVFVSTTPTVKKLNSCVKEANTSVKSNMSKATAQKWSKETACINDKQVVENMRSCYQTAEKQGFIPISFIEAIGRVIIPKFFSLSDAIEMHNVSCANYPQYLVK